MEEFISDAEIEARVRNTLRINRRTLGTADELAAQACSAFDMFEGGSTPDALRVPDRVTAIAETVWARHREAQVKIGLAVLEVVVDQVKHTDRFPDSVRLALSGDEDRGPSDSEIVDAVAALRRLVK